MRGTKFDRDTEKELQTFLKGKTPERIWQICEALGVESSDSNLNPFYRNKELFYSVWPHHAS